MWETGEGLDIRQLVHALLEDREAIESVERVLEEEGLEADFAQQVLVTDVLEPFHQFILYFSCLLPQARHSNIDGKLL